MRRADNLITFMCRLPRNLGASTSWNPKGLSRPGIALSYGRTTKTSHCNMSRRHNTKWRVYLFTHIHAWLQLLYPHSTPESYITPRYYRKYVHRKFKSEFLMCHCIFLIFNTTLLWTQFFELVFRGWWCKLSYLLTVAVIFVAFHLYGTKMERFLCLVPLYTAWLFYCLWVLICTFKLVVKFLVCYFCNYECHQCFNRKMTKDNSF
jgi:hypothetical protein